MEEEASLHYRIVYCSRSQIAGNPQKVASALEGILLVSRARNTVNDVTGALLFNGEAFAQVLEGPRSAVDATYERICADTRHTEVTLLERAYQVHRNFAEWVMAYADESASASQTLQFDSAEIDPTGFAQQILRSLTSAMHARSSSMQL